MFKFLRQTLSLDQQHNDEIREVNQLSQNLEQFQFAHVENQPIEQIDLCGTFEEMGAQLVEKQQNELKQQLNDNIAQLVPENQALQEQFEKDIEAFLETIENKYPPEFKAFFQGAEQKAQALKLELTKKDFIRLDQSLMISYMAFAADQVAQTGNKPNSFGACSFAGIRNPNGVGFISNFDWPKRFQEAMTKRPKIFTMTYVGPDVSNYPNQVWMLAQSGQISGIRLINEQFLSLIVNANASTDGVPNFERPYEFSQFVLMLMQSSELDELTNKVTNMAPDFPFILPICSKDSLWCAEISTTAPNKQNYEVRFRGADTHPGDLSLPSMDYDQDGNRLVATNQVRLNGWEKVFQHNPYVDFLCYSEERHYNLSRRLEELVNEYQTLSLEDAKKALQALAEREIKDTTPIAQRGATVPRKADDVYQTPAATFYTLTFNYDKTARDGKGQAIMTTRFQQVDPENESNGKWTPWHQTSIQTREKNIKSDHNAAIQSVKTEAAKLPCP